MNSQSMVMNKSTIRKMGLEALNEKLGPIGMVEFIQQFDSGYGDYTKERHNWLDALTIEDICNEIKHSAASMAPGDSGKSPLEDIPYIKAKITTQEIVELLRECRAGV